MLENDDINGDEDVPMMPGSDDEFGSEGSGDELLDDMGEEDVHTTSEVCAGEEGEQNGSEDEFHHQNYFDDMGEENVQTTSEASAGLREQSNSVHLENTLPQSTNVTHDGAQASNVPQRWSSSFTPIAVTPFSNPVGPTFTVGEDAGEIFNHFFTDSLIDHIVIQTNKYAQETMEPTKFLKWKSVTTEELRAYFGFMILMGLVRMPELEDYWKLDPVFNYPPIASRISRNRFKLGKVRPVIEEISKSLLHNYDVSRVDEAMIPFKGRSYLKQYLPKKPVKWGIKAWCLADSHNGYVQKVDVYAGKTMGERKDWNMGEQVVLDLTYHLRGKYHHVYCDNFFTSSRLLEELLANGIYGCGTVRQNTKGYPAHLKMSGKGKRAQRKLGLINRVQSNVKDMVQTVTKAAVAYFNQLIKVKPIGIPLLLDRSCSSTSKYVKGIRYCDNSCAPQTLCVETVVPVDHLQPCRVCKGGQCANSTTDPKSPGVPFTDYILYVTAVNTKNCATSSAYASACQTESSLDRPIAGMINFCPGEMLQATIESMIAVAKHEIIHSLGFSPYYFAFYRDQNGFPRTPRDPYTNLPSVVNGQYDISKVVMTYNHTNWAVANGIINHKVNMMFTPNVVARARAHFNCPTLPGLELENGGGPGSEMSHWEARILGTELMTSTPAFNLKLSEMTLALLQDTGWYQVDFSKAEPLQWGKNAGCQFVLGSCRGYINNRLPTGGSTVPFCSDITNTSKPLKLGCTLDRDATGYCNLRKLSEVLPRDYQYLGTDIGGALPIYDYCPFYNAARGINFLGETYGPGSSCLLEGKKGWSVTTVSTGKVIVRDPNNYGAGCYQVSTTKGITTVTVLNTAYKCSQRGQQIDISIVLNGLKYEGSILCP
ncbi:hypothetical protein EMCRGX_G003113 [Ephydatia muelleri]